MSRRSGATNTQKTVMIAIYQGWLLRYVDKYGWCLFQPGWQRPFATVKQRTVEEMTEADWLTPGQTPNGLGYRPAKDLTPAGLRYARRLVDEDWGQSLEWSPHTLVGDHDDSVKTGEFRLAA